MMKIQLDASAVRSLIADNEQFELDLTRGVMANMTAHIVIMLQKKMEKSYAQQIHEHVQKEFAGLVRKHVGTKDGSKPPTLNAEFQAKITEVMLGSIDSEVSALRTRAEAAIRAKLEDIGPRIETAIENRMGRVMIEEINKRVDAKVREILTKAAQGVQA